MNIRRSLIASEAAVHDLDLKSTFSPNCGLEISQTDTAALSGCFPLRFGRSISGLTRAGSAGDLEIDVLPLGMAGP